jgi:hypothetical protein
MPTRCVPLDTSPHTRTQSPEKFQKSLAELTAAVEAERGAVEEADRACSELAARQEMVSKVRRRRRRGPDVAWRCGREVQVVSKSH